MEYPTEKYSSLLSNCKTATHRYHPNYSLWVLVVTISISSPYVLFVFDYLDVTRYLYLYLYIYIYIYIVHSHEFCSVPFCLFLFSFIYLYVCVYVCCLCMNMYMYMYISPSHQEWCDDDIDTDPIYCMWDIYACVHEGKKRRQYCFLSS